VAVDEATDSVTLPWGGARNAECAPLRVTVPTDGSLCLFLTSLQIADEGGHFSPLRVIYSEHLGRRTP
jgi:hypothetical protein